MRRSRFVHLSLCSLASLFAATHARAHEGDPKALERHRRVEASGREGRDLALSSDSFAFPASNVQLLSWTTLRDLGTPIETANSCFGYASPSGREYAILGTSRGTAFVEVTDPGAPELVAFVAGTWESLWRDVKVYQHWCYVSTEAIDGTFVIDLGAIDQGIVTHVDTVTGPNDLPTHTIAVDPTSGFLYRCGGGQNGLRIYSLADPAHPAYVGAWQNHYVHEAQVVTYTSGPYAGKQIAFACGGFNGGFAQTGIDILDVTNKSSIQLLKHLSYSGSGYSHQAWLSPDRKYLYQNDEKDDQNGTAPPSTTRVFDVQSLSGAHLVGTFTSGAGSIDHNLYTKGDLVFEANYTSGLRVFDATNPTSPQPIGWFDTYPEDDSPRFKGLWNNYPYLPSGYVLGSDIEKGLFVWWPGAPKLSFAFAGGAAPDAFPPQGGPLDVTIGEAAPGTLVAGSAALHWDLGAGWQQAPLAAQGGGVFRADLPPAPCGGDVAWYLSARASDGSTWHWPQGAPTIVAHATAATSLAVVLEDHCEAQGGWTAGVAGDTASRGQWELADPDPTLAQTDDDHTGGTATRCFVTGAVGEPYTLGQDDVDGGTTTLLSPVYDLSAVAHPVVRYWRWYSTHLGPAPLDEDAFVVDVSNDGGQNWTNVETVGPGGPGTSGGWILHQFDLAAHVAPTSQVRLRFVASDLANPSNVEAAIDDLAVLDVGCPPVLPTTYCTAKTNSQGCAPAIGWSGLPSAGSPQPFLVTAGQVINQKTGILIYGLARASTPFQGGTLCVGQPFQRTAAQGSGGNAGPDDCSGSFAYDMNARIQSGVDPQLAVGATVDAQYWYRDPADPAGFATGLSDALEFVVGP